VLLVLRQLQANALEKLRMPRPRLDKAFGERADPPAISVRVGRGDRYSAALCLSRQGHHRSRSARQYRRARQRASNACICRYKSGGSRARYDVVALELDALALATRGDTAGEMYAQLLFDSHDYTLAARAFAQSPAVARPPRGAARTAASAAKGRARQVAHWP
jgi:hypothetical protein